MNDQKTPLSEQAAIELDRTGQDNIIVEMNRIHAALEAKLADAIAERSYAEDIAREAEQRTRDALTDANKAKSDMRIAQSEFIKGEAEIARLKVWGSDSHVTDLEAKLAETEHERDVAEAHWNNLKRDFEAAEQRLTELPLHLYPPENGKRT